MEVIRITFLGYYAGKTAFIRSFFGIEFYSQSLCSIGLEKHEKRLKLTNGNEVKLILWDTAGNERFRDISAKTLDKANGCLLMYDITKNNSFEAVLYWIEKIKQLKLNIPTILIGNMCDLDYRRVIPKEKGEELSKKNDFHFYESSSKESINIYEP